MHPMSNGPVKRLLLLNGENGFFSETYTSHIGILCIILRRTLETITCRLYELQTIL